MKKTLTFAIFSLLFGSLFAQHEPIQPFEELGVKVKILTLSNGKYQETFSNDTIMRIGSVMFHRFRGEVVVVVEDDTLYGEYSLQPEAVSRWLSPDPLGAKYPNWSPYVGMNDNPILFVDPDGMENIVAIGGADIKQNDRYKFVNSGLGQAFSYGAAERTTIVLMTANMTKDEIAQVQQSVAAGNANLYDGKEVVSLITVGSADELANYINSKSAADGSISQDRLADKVTDLAVFGHGVPGSMEFGYDYQSTTSTEEQQMSFGSAQIGKLDPQAFDNSKICLYTCNSAAEANGVNVARDMSKQTNSTVSGFDGHSSYKGIYSLWDRALKKAGYQILPAGNTPGEGAGATQKIYKNGTEQ